MHVLPSETAAPGEGVEMSLISALPRVDVSCHAQVAS